MLSVRFLGYEQGKRDILLKERSLLLATFRLEYVARSMRCTDNKGDNWCFVKRHRGEYILSGIEFWVTKTRKARKTERSLCKSMFQVANWVVLALVTPPKS
jgi:hypothetical protein